MRYLETLLSNDPQALGERARRMVDLPEAIQTP